MRGIGRATALQLARGGAHVAIGYGSRKETAEQVVAEIRGLGRKSLAGACDVSQQDQIDALVAATGGSWDQSTYCATAARSATSQAMPSCTFERWFATIDANLNGAFRVVFAVKDEMIRRGFGRIVLFSSVAALRPRAMQIHYSAAKAGVIALRVAAPTPSLRMASASIALPPD